MNRQITATATSVVTTGVKNAVRKKPFHRTSFDCIIRAAASETPIERGPPIRRNSSVFRNAFQNRGSDRSWA